MYDDYYSMFKKVVHLKVLATETIQQCTTDIFLQLCFYILYRYISLCNLHAHSVFHWNIFNMIHKYICILFYNCPLLIPFVIWYFFLLFRNQYYEIMQTNIKIGPFNDSSRHHRMQQNKFYTTRIEARTSAKHADPLANIATESVGNFQILIH